MASFSQLASIMDPVDPPKTLRALALRHRWLTPEQTDHVSMQSMLERHDNPLTTRQHFLWYNTFLLQGFELSPCNIPVLIEHLVRGLPITPKEWLDALNLSPETVAQAFGYGVPEIVKAFSISGGMLKEAFSGLVGVLTGGLVDLDDIDLGSLLNKFDINVEALMNVFGISLVDILVKFCRQTIDVLKSHFGIDLRTISIGAKPDREKRGWEIGHAINENYHIVALCEVFEEASKDRIYKNAGRTGKQLSAVSGPDDTNELVSSGLFTVTFDRPIVGASPSIVFVNRGEKWRDSDAWANKGVLLTRVQMGVGILEVYSTHLISGGDIWGADSFPGNTFPELIPTDAEVFDLQMKQVDELIAFYRDTHDPRNVAVIVGDFNLAAHQGDKFKKLQAKMKKIGMIDTWPFFHRSKVDSSFKTTYNIPRGDSHSATDDLPSIDNVCPLTDGTYCIDGAEDPAKVEGRIDYIFMEVPTQQHTYHLDYTRIRRRPFPRVLPEDIPAPQLGALGIPKWLSDHLGLDMTLIASPKR